MKNNGVLRRHTLDTIADTHLVRRDGGVFPGLCRAHVRRQYLFPSLLHHGIRRALQLIGVALYVAVREVRDIDASGRARRPEER